MFFSSAEKAGGWGSSVHKAKGLRLILLRGGQSLWQAQDINGAQSGFYPGLEPPRSFAPLCLAQPEERGPG